MNKNIAVLITCHNRKAKTLQCLQQLIEATLPAGFELKVYLVDDGSTDGTGDAVRLQFPQVSVIQGDGQLFWNRGMHLAWHTAVTEQVHDFYLWLNDDTLLLNNALNVLLEGFITYGENCIYVGATKSEKCDEVTYSGFDCSDLLLKPNGMWQECDYFNGNIVLIPNAVFKKVGMTDSTFHHALGDFDYGLRAKSTGIKLYVSPVVLGYCELHEHLPKWCNPKVSFWVRLVELYKPLGNNPFEFFKFANRHSGLLTALKNFATIHFRMMFPRIYNVKKNIK